MNYAERTYTHVRNKRGEVLRIGEAVPPRPARIEGHAVIVQSALLNKCKHDAPDVIVMRACVYSALALVAMRMAGWLS
jgi:hypothetical protein